ncbi:hypothetical protein BC936DRAFT_145907 [Jimgerdemannia flammicorona]|uniref:Uncharacterized protein n=1 Tax=Jimgerdemannia flammicorona TaxID=994334 RepID=A0A433D8U1_9FUNG|nr:hypothetical protein BC936DRAFT_145907 [Jimgerdemannia flammicorona]
MSMGNVYRSELDLGHLLVEDDVVILDEHVPEDGEVEAAVAEPGDAGAVIVLIKDEVGTRHLEISAADGEMEVGDFGTVARDRVRSIVVIGRAHLLGHRGSNVVGEEAKGGPGVDDGLELLGHGFGTSRQTVDGDAPEALAVVDRHSGQFAADLGFVVATEGVCTTY